MPNCNIRGGVVNDTSSTAVPPLYDYLLRLLRAATNLDAHCGSRLFASVAKGLSMVAELGYPYQVLFPPLSASNGVLRADRAELREYADQPSGMATAPPGDRQRPQAGR